MQHGKGEIITTEKRKSHRTDTTSFNCRLDSSQCKEYAKRLFLLHTKRLHKLLILYRCITLLYKNEISLHLSSGLNAGEYFFGQKR